MKRTPIGIIAKEVWRQEDNGNTVDIIFCEAYQEYQMIDRDTREIYFVGDSLIDLAAQIKGYNCD